MTTLLTAQAARKLVTGTEERKDELIKKMNSIIESQANIGKKWAHYPTDINEEEKEFLSDELVMKGFTVKQDNPCINW